MLLKTGVDISRLRPEVRKKLNQVEELVLSMTQLELVITSTYEGDHSPGSLHYANLAFDMRTEAGSQLFAKHLKLLLGPDYDVVSEHDHIHIEYDPDVLP